MRGVDWQKYCSFSSSDREVAVVEPIRVECYFAQVQSVRQDSRYSVILHGVNRLTLVELPEKRHGKIDPVFPCTVYRECDLDKDLTPPESVLVGDTVLLHMSYYPERVIRWQQIPTQN